MKLNEIEGLVLGMCRYKSNKEKRAGRNAYGSYREIIVGDVIRKKVIVENYTTSHKPYEGYNMATGRLGNAN